MNETLNPKPSGFTANGLHTWGILFVAAGAAGRALLQNAMLHTHSLSGAELFRLLETNPDAMGMLTLALILEVIYACAVPIFAFLLVEGFCCTSNFKNYVLRVLGVAVLAELPYNFSMTGKLLVMESRNPVFALAICLVVLYLYSRFSEKSLKNFGIKALVTAAAFVWMGMLSIDEGHCLLLLTVVIWAVRNRQNFRAIIGCTAAFACTIFSLHYIAAPFSFLAIHYYNGEKGTDNKLVNYLSYPVLLLALGIAAMLMGK